MKTVKVPDTVCGILWDILKNIMMVMCVTASLLVLLYIAWIVCDNKKSEFGNPSNLNTLPGVKK
ncbi:MAG: hypothetical protein IPP74_13570 [Alphaproteobacteria bacterium]|nr:hypothetical protein [Alphaproteobacteria bacterium]